MTEPGAVLLDTCAVIWWVNGDLSDDSIEVLVRAGLADAILISPISAWELGMLSSPKRRSPRLTLLPDPLSWFARVMDRPGVKRADLTASAAMSASYLPEPLHGDPADRLLIATARELNVPILTRDKEMLAYGGAGHVATLAC
jgi:PIN domain nuclease of toxin-antitoxin system